MYKLLVIVFLLLVMCIIMITVIGYYKSDYLTIFFIIVSILLGVLFISRRVLLNQCNVDDNGSHTGIYTDGEVMNILRNQNNADQLDNIVAMMRKELRNKKYIENYTVSREMDGTISGVHPNKIRSLNSKELTRVSNTLKEYLE